MVIVENAPFVPAQGHNVTVTPAAPLAQLSQLCKHVAPITPSGVSHPTCVGGQMAYHQSGEESLNWKTLRTERGSGCPGGSWSQCTQNSGSWIQKVFDV